MEEQELTVTLDGSSEAIQAGEKRSEVLNVIIENILPTKLALKAEELSLSQTRRLWRSIG